MTPARIKRSEQAAHIGRAARVIIRTRRPSFLCRSRRIVGKRGAEKPPMKRDLSAPSYHKPARVEQLGIPPQCGRGGASTTCTWSRRFERRSCDERATRVGAASRCRSLGLSPSRPRALRTTASGTSPGDTWCGLGGGERSLGSFRDDVAAPQRRLESCDGGCAHLSITQVKLFELGQLRQVQGALVGNGTLSQ